MKRLLGKIFSPPYAGLPWLLFLYAALTSVLCHGNIYEGRLLDFDDQVRMTEILNWVNGAGWYDRTLTRVNAPEGFTSIWSRLVEIPYALIILAAQNFMSQRTVALVAAAIVPLAELALLFTFVLPYFARPLLGKAKARLVVAFAFFTSILNPVSFSLSGFSIGQASHHPWYIILTLLMFGATARIVMGSPQRAPVFMLGSSIALLTAVGIEGFPLIADAATILAFTGWGFARPQIAARAAIGFFCGAIGSFLLLPLQQPPAHFFEVSFAAPSILGAILVATAALFLKIEHLALRRWPRRKAETAIGLLLIAALFAAALVTAFPPILDGGGAGLSPAERHMASLDHTEAKPVIANAPDAVDLASFLIPSIFALAASLYALFTTKTRRRRAIHVSYFGFILVATGMSEIFSRYYHHAMTTACAWLAWAWLRLQTRLPRGNYRRIAAAAIFIALGPFWLLLLPALASGRPVLPQILLFPAHLQLINDLCDPIPAGKFINAHYPPRTNLAVAYWQSSEFLYYTDLHIDFLANYPSHDKFLANYALFSSRDPKAWQMIIASHRIDLLTACKAPPFYRPGAAPETQILLARLQAGQPPPWLKPVEPGQPLNYVIYEVDHKALENAP